ncbi:hypothetical protein [Streptomyces sp. NPDC051665]|uniref:hypothetical protein n=1 Tax=Streptomyces sp. NPDC051665 TaxID=3154647 RepID=UPI003416052A
MTTTDLHQPTSSPALHTLPDHPETDRTTTTDPQQPTTPHTLPDRPETDRTTIADPHHQTSPNAAHTLTDRPGVTA